MKLFKKYALALCAAFIMVLSWGSTAQAEELDVVIEEVTPEADEDIPAATYNDSILLDTSFIGAHINYGKDINIPFNVWCYGNYNQKYYVKIKDTAGQVVASAEGFTKQGWTGQLKLTIVWAAEDVAQCNPGRYTIECYTTYDDNNIDCSVYLERGWIKENGKWKYYNYYDNACTGLYRINKTYYLFNNKGEMLTGWQYYGKKWRYFNASGAMQTGWVKLSNKWYYLDEDNTGAMLTGWQKIDGAWYYLGTDGVMRSGWQQIGGKWYYFKSGVMQTGWVTIGKTWYRMDANGVMQTGWVKVGSTWYYMNGSGEMQTGWQKIGGSWYYFYSSGKMATSTTIDGCRINANGVWVQ